MADGGGGASGVLGVLVGAMLVLFIGAGVLMATGTIGANKAPSFTIRRISLVVSVFDIRRHDGTDAHFALAV